MKIYFVPFLLDFILFMVQLRLSDAAGREMHLSNGQATGLLVVFSLTYMLCCPLVGRVLNARTTKPILLFSIAAILFLSVPLLWTKAFWPAFLLMGGSGAAAALAFNAFQSLVREKTPSGGLGATVAKYNVSWSTGIGLGFLLGGVLTSLGQPIWLSLFCGVAVMAIFAMVWSEKPLQSATSSTRNEDADLHSADYGDARYIVIAWSLCIAANFVQRPLVTFVSKFSAQDDNSAWVAGTLLCALMWSQACGGWLCYRNPQWLYRAKPLAFFQIGAIAVLCVLWLSQSYVVSLLAMMALGLLHGFAFFWSVFYCSNSADSARNVGINEMAVGFGNIGGMLACNWAIRAFVSDAAFYPTTIAFSVLMLAARTLWLRSSRQREIMAAM